MGKKKAAAPFQLDRLSPSAEVLRILFQALGSCKQLIDIVPCRFSILAAVCGANASVLCQLSRSIPVGEPLQIVALSSAPRRISGLCEPPPGGLSDRLGGSRLQFGLLTLLGCRPPLRRDRGDVTHHHAEARNQAQCEDQPEQLLSLHGLIHRFGRLDYYHGPSPVSRHLPPPRTSQGQSDPRGER